MSRTYRGLRLPVVRRIVYGYQGRPWSLNKPKTYRHALAFLGGKAFISEIHELLEQHVPDHHQADLSLTLAELRQDLVKTTGISPVSRGSYEVHLTHQDRDNWGYYWL